MLELKTYQSRALDAFTQWLEALHAAKEQSTTAIKAWPEAAGEIPDAVRNYPGMAWEKLSGSGGVAHTARRYAGTLNVPTMRIVRFRISASKYRQAAVKPCLRLPLWNVSIDKPG